MGKEKTGGTKPAKAHIGLLCEPDNFLDYVLPDVNQEIKAPHHMAFLEFCVLALFPKQAPTRQCLRSPGLCISKEGKVNTLCMQNDFKGTQSFLF